MKQWQSMLVLFLLFLLFVLALLGSSFFSFLHLSARAIFILHATGGVVMIATTLIVVLVIPLKKDE